MCTSDLLFTTGSRFAYENRSAIFPAKSIIDFHFAIATLIAIEKCSGKITIRFFFKNQCRPPPPPKVAVVGFLKNRNGGDGGETPWIPGAPPGSHGSATTTLNPMQPEPFPMNICPCRNRILVALTACLLLAGIPGALAGVTVGAGGPGGTISVATFPSGAAVYLDNEYRGISPIEMPGLPPGTYQVNISMAGYNFETYTISLDHGSTRELMVNLEPGSSAGASARKRPGVGSIAIDSDPGGAAVYLDGAPAGTTPVTRSALVLNNVPDGEHTVTVELTGHPVYTANVTVIKNNVVKVGADFVTRTSTITSGTAIATTDRPRPAPLSPPVVLAAAGLAALVAAFRRS